MQYDVAIVGAGPAGASAAIFTARAGLKTIVLDNDTGLTRRAQVNNHLGLVEGVSGPELVERGHQQAEKAGAVRVKAKVTGVERAANGFVLSTDAGEGQERFEATEVILCLGANPELGKRAGVSSTPGTEPYIKEVLVVDEQGRTNVHGIWAAGVCAGVSVHTIVTSGDGARVAIHLVSARKGERYVDHDVLK